MQPPSKLLYAHPPTPVKLGKHQILERFLNLLQLALFDPGVNPTLFEN